MKLHLEALVKGRLLGDQLNPWFDEVWKDISRTNPISLCKLNQSLRECSLQNLAYFKIDSKVENVMNVAVLFYETFKKYIQTICRDQPDSACIHENFDGEKYFNDHILNAKSE